MSLCPGVTGCSVPVCAGAPRLCKPGLCHRTQILKESFTRDSRGISPCCPMPGTAPRAGTPAGAGLWYQEGLLCLWISLGSGTRRRQGLAGADPSRSVLCLVPARVPVLQLHPPCPSQAPEPSPAVPMALCGPGLAFLCPEIPQSTGSWEARRLLLDTAKVL